MNKEILNKEVQEWLSANANSDTKKLIFQKSPFSSILMSELVDQIESKKKCIKKLPSWFNISSVYYPVKLSVEQTSSEQTAKYKANLVAGDSLLDMTGGLGVDTFFFSKRIKEVVHVEHNESLSQIAKHNFIQLKANNISCFCEDGLGYLKSAGKTFDWIYIDPARRHNSKGKVYFLEDCEPNVPINLDVIFKHAKHVLVKTSPMLDVTQGLRELKFVKEIHVVSLNNEVKELLWVLEKNFDGDIQCKAVNLDTNNPVQEFIWGGQKEARVQIGEVGAYVYEPNASILKFSSVNLLLNKCNLIKISNRTQLLSGDLVDEFPGKIFKVLTSFPFNKKEINKRYKGKKANVISRNFSLGAEEVKKKFGIKDGGELFLFFTTDSKNNKLVIEGGRVI